MGVAEEKLDNEGKERTRKKTGGVASYKVGRESYWKINIRLKLPDGRVIQHRQRRIPTREQAQMLVAKLKASAFEGCYFERAKPIALTVAEAWSNYEPISERDNDSWKSDAGRAKHLLRHLGREQVMGLTLATVDAYRNRRLGEVTRKGTPPSPAQLDRELELLKRVINYEVNCGRLPHNPIAGVALLKVPNVRRVVIDEARFTQVLRAAGGHLKPVLVVAYDQALRLAEVLQLRRSQLDLRRGVVVLNPSDTKTDEGRTVMLTQRSIEALRRLPARIGTEYVFANPETGRPWRQSTIRAWFLDACEAVGVDVEDPGKRWWFHDTRRSGVTNARKRGVPESVVMKISGHKTRAVFDRYNIVDEADLKEAVRRIEAGQREEVGEVGQEQGKAAPKASQKVESPTG